MRIIKELVRDVPKGESYRYSDAGGTSFTVEGPSTVRITATQERRAPDRHYKYGSSYDPRIRALERRGVKIAPGLAEGGEVRIKDRRTNKDRRVANLDCEYYRRMIYDRRKV